MHPSSKLPRRPWPDEDVLSLVRDHEATVRAYLRSLGCPVDRVEDFAQETFLRFLTRTDASVAEPARGGYLRKVARTLYLNSLRAEAARPRYVEIDQAWLEFDPGDDGSAYMAALHDCVERLAERSREGLRLRYGLGLPRSVIAERIGLSLGGVKSLLLRSKERLRECIVRKLNEATLGAPAVPDGELSR